MNDYLNVIIWSVGIGICLCNFYIYYNKKVLGNFVCALLEKEIFLPESAQSLEQLGFAKKRIIKRALSTESATLFGVVAQGEAQSTYYIPEEKKDKAIRLFASKGASIVTVIGASVLILLVAYLLSVLLPWLIPMVQNAFKGGQIQ